MHPDTQPVTRAPQTLPPPVPAHQAHMDAKLSKTQRAVLRMLAAVQPFPVTRAEIMEQLSMPRAALDGALTRLISYGFIRYYPGTGPHPRRYQVTEDGITRAARTRPRLTP